MFVALSASPAALADAHADEQAANPAGVILHWDGNAWTVVDSPTHNKLRSVAIVSATDGWAIGDEGTTLRYRLVSTAVELSGLRAQATTAGAPLRALVAASAAALLAGAAALRRKRRHPSRQDVPGAALPCRASFRLRLAA